MGSGESIPANRGVVGSTGGVGVGGVDAESDEDEVGVLELEAVLCCEEVEEAIDAVAVVAEASSLIEADESLESSSEKSSEEGDAVALFAELDVLVADAAPLPVAAVSGTALPAVHVASGTPLMMPSFESPRQQVKSLASLLLPVPPIRSHRNSSCRCRRRSRWSRR